MTMNRDNEEQRPISQTLCGALQKEANCKCLVLSVLIYGCLAAVTWCRCANVTKIVINFSKYPLKSTRHVSPCDDGYIYIPVAFMGMLYLVYLVECYHSPIRIDLKHGESQDSILSKLSQLRLAQPTIWWKAVCYHYVRRKRQITRYRNGDHYTTTQVYYERVNTNAATSYYFYDYCGVRDISKELTLNPKIPITKITLSKGFAFSNMRSATEFEEARSRFFAEQELRDDYMEMREGLDLGYNFTVNTTLVAVLGRPWFTNSYVYWLLSALLLSWPLRIIIECKTQYADYQVTKLFGVNYDTPTSGEQIHASSSQLSAPGSYMLAPSYSEALLMEPAVSSTSSANISSNQVDSGMMVPSYSEALLYETAAARHSQATHDELANHSESLLAVVEIQPDEICNCSCHRSTLTTESHSNDCRLLRGQSNPEINSCIVCSTSSSRSVSSVITRDISEPNLRTNSDDLTCGLSMQFLRLNGQSLENIIEHEEPINLGNSVRPLGNKGAIPKRKISGENSIKSCVESRPINDVIVSQSDISSSKTYLCLKSILKPNRRRYTLVTTDEFKNFAASNRAVNQIVGNHSESLIWRTENSKRRQSAAFDDTKPEFNAHRTLIFASPIHEIFRPNDPYSRNPERHVKLPHHDECPESDLPVFTRLGQSLSALAEPYSTNNNASSVSKRGRSKRFKHHRTLSIEPECLQFYSAASPQSSNSSSPSAITATPHRLMRSLTERRPVASRSDKILLRRSFTDERTDFGPARRVNLNMETSL